MICQKERGGLWECIVEEHFLSFLVQSSSFYSERCVNHLLSVSTSCELMESDGWWWFIGLDLVVVNCSYPGGQSESIDLVQVDLDRSLFQLVTNCVVVLPLCSLIRFIDTPGSTLPACNYHTPSFYWVATGSTWAEQSSGVTPSTK